jgi:Fe2+ transport system protein FeoA
MSKLKFQIKLKIQMSNRFLELGIMEGVGIEKYMIKEG